MTNMKKFECKNLGVDCPFQVQAEDAEEVVTKAEEHAAMAHNMPRGDETKNKIRAVIKDVV